jgi:hypothetical protein
MSKNFAGVWNADLSKSKFIGPSPKGMTVKISHVGPELTEEILVTRPDGSMETIVFKCQTDGKLGTGQLNGNEVRGKARWQGDNLVIESWIQAGERSVHLCDYWSLSSDGKTLSMEHINDDLAGQLTVLHRA